MSGNVNSHQHLNNGQQIFVMADESQLPIIWQFCHSRRLQSNNHAVKILRTTREIDGLCNRRHMSTCAVTTVLLNNQNYYTNYYTKIINFLLY